MKLDVDELLELARQRTGLKDFGSNDFMPGLKLLVEDVNTSAGIRDASWNEMIEQRFVRLLVNRLWLAKDLTGHPEIAREEIGSPVIIASLPRTGSTKLHRMLGASGTFQTLRFWQVHMFARIPGQPDGGREQRIRETRAYEQWMYRMSPSILTGHPMFTDEPEEDQWLMEATFRHPLQFGIFESPRYAQWMMESDKAPMFDYFLTALKYLQWQDGAQRHRPWLLKTPNHMGNEPMLTRVYDKPRFIITHRDPARCVASIVATTIAFRKLYSDRDTRAPLMAGAMALFSAVTAAHLQWRDSKPDVEILDLGFREITADGIGTARRVHEFLGLPFTREAEAGVRRWEADNPKDKHGKADYSAEALGTTDEKIRAEFAPYIARFAPYLA